MTAVLDDEDVVPAEVLVDIVGDVFESLLGHESDRPYRVPFGEPGTPVGAVISITGGWSGSVVLRVSRDFAEHVAARLFELPEGTASEADVRDVLGELVNVVGGNLKALLPGPNGLSLPSPSLTDVPVPTGGLAVSLRWGVETLQLFMTPDAGSPYPRP